ncbi:hypothetical protein FZEAL_1194 [Fusarium zealandicum]|uniref:Peptidase C14 caspase domain-containing protein n=1 Tax=Fusarium zealandicum TaxID=1053134 RepID=A0A8H4XP46_9HYPO|nr:hypothetical protein FZEAL_1194 [Fusarium zealandicum]
MDQTTQNQPAHYAILVGINAYPDKPLKGCVRDIENVRSLLQQHKPPVQIKVFTATSNPNGEDLGPIEDTKSLPTHSNVTAALEHITFNAQRGDRVYIHYSGHGTQVERKSAFSNTSTRDLALPLLHGDRGGGTRCLGGHQLGMKLNAMVNKGLVVTLVLDCCFAASVYRQDRLNVRFLPPSPEYGLDFTDDGDKTIESAEETSSAYRDVSMTPSWLIDPKGYAVLSGCDSHEEATEVILKGESYGALSHHLYLTLGDNGLNRRHKDIHRRLCVKFRESALNQSPKLYGNKDQCFFGQPEIESTVETISLVRDGQNLLLQAGRAHGISDGDELILYPSTLSNRDPGLPTNIIAATVDSAQPLTSTLVLGGTPNSSTLINWVAELRTRSCLRGFPVSLSENLHRTDEWLKTLDMRSLMTRGPAEDQPFAFHVGLVDKEYTILNGSGQQVMNLPPMPQDLVGSDDVSAVIEHLTRYQLVKSLRNDSPADDFQNSFDINIVNPAGDYFAPGCVIEVEQNDSKKPMFELQVRNRGHKFLYVFVYDMGPFWQIEDIFCGGYESLSPPNSSKGFSGVYKKKMRTTVPQQMREKGSQQCDDILKVFITSQPTSFDLLDLPKIGHPSQKQSGDRSSRLGGDGPEDWVAVNFPIRTRVRSEEGE